MLSHDEPVLSPGRPVRTRVTCPDVNRSLMPLPLSHAYGLLVTVVGHARGRAGPITVLMRWFDPSAFLSS